MGVVESALGFQQVLDLFQIKLLRLNQSLLNPLLSSSGSAQALRLSQAQTQAQ